MSANDLSIRRAIPDDAGMLAEISRQTFYETFAAQNTEEDMQQYLHDQLGEPKLLRELATPGSSFYFLYKGQQTAGYLKLNCQNAQTIPGKGGSLEIERIYVLKQFQGMGLGKELLNHALEQAVEENCTSVWLGVWEHNTRAIAFYERNGFLRTGAHDFILGNDVQTDLIMELPLTHS